MISKWAVAGLLANFAGLATADCECGYSVNVTRDTKPLEAFTDLLETNYLKDQNISHNTDWVIQSYTKAFDASVKPRALGMIAQAANVVSNPLKDATKYNSGGVNGGDAGMQLFVRGGAQPADNLVPIAEIGTKRKDMLYGSFRTSLKMTDINGTCGAVFFYYNETQEIDFEFLSYQKGNKSFGQINLVLHPMNDKPFETKDSTQFDNFPLDFQPSEGFHEYRFDWMPGNVSFYADGKFMRSLTDGVPDTPGGVIMKHWSNGQSTWSQGPPVRDAVMTVEYSKFYFNSTDPARQSDIKRLCKDPSAATAVCAVAPVTDSPGSSTDFGFFSTQTNKTAGQSEKNAGGRASTASTILFATALLTALSLAL